MRTIDAPLDGAGLRVGIVAGRFNDFVLSLIHISEPTRPY